jgi:uncharacterized membrane protein
MTRAGGSYDVFTVVLAVALAVTARWAMAAVVALWLIWVRDRVVKDDA